MKDLRADGSIPGENKFARIYEVKGEDWHGYNMWTGETADDNAWPQQSDIEKYPTFVKWETSVLDYQEAEERIRLLNKTPQYNISTLLLDIGLNGEMSELMERVHEHDIVLGQLDMNKMSPIKWNTLLAIQQSFSRQYLRLYVNEENGLVLSTDYRYNEIRDKHQIATGWMTVGLDFIFDKDRPQDRFD